MVRRYRVRLYERNRDITPGEAPIMAALDFTDGPGLRTTEGQLNELVTSLSYAAGMRGERTLQCHLRVEDWESGRVVCMWPATSWKEQR